VAFAPAGDRVVSVSWGRTLKVWDAYTGQAVDDLSKLCEGGYGTGVAWAKGGGRIAVAAGALLILGTHKRTVEHRIWLEVGR
jgi:hypothetical protein